MLLNETCVINDTFSSLTYVGVFSEAGAHVPPSACLPLLVLSLSLSLTFSLSLSLSRPALIKLTLQTGEIKESKDGNQSLAISALHHGVDSL